MPHIYIYIHTYTYTHAHTQISLSIYIHIQYVHYTIYIYPRHIMMCPVSILRLFPSISGPVQQHSDYVSLLASGFLVVNSESDESSKAAWFALTTQPQIKNHEKWPPVCHRRVELSISDRSRTGLHHPTETSTSSKTMPSQLLRRLCGNQVRSQRFTIPLPMIALLHLTSTSCLAGFFTNQVFHLSIAPHCPPSNLSHPCPGPQVSRPQ